MIDYERRRINKFLDLLESQQEEATASDNLYITQQRAFGAYIVLTHLDERYLAARAYDIYKGPLTPLEEAE